MSTFDRTMMLLALAVSAFVVLFALHTLNGVLEQVREPEAVQHIDRRLPPPKPMGPLRRSMECDVWTELCA